MLKLKQLIREIYSKSEVYNKILKHGNFDDLINAYKHFNGDKELFNWYRKIVYSVKDELDGDEFISNYGYDIYDENKIKRISFDKVFSDLILDYFNKNTKVENMAKEMLKELYYELDDRQLEEFNIDIS